MCLMELDKLIAYLDPSLEWLIVQCLVVASGELAKGMFGVRQRLVELVQPPVIALQVLLILRIDCTQFSV